MKPIYKPSGKALEYGELALNLHNTCPHRCYYCYAPGVTHKSPEDYFCYNGYRPEIIEATKRQIEKEGITGKLIHIPFIGDAYPKGYDSSITREVIKLLKDSGNYAQILTKNGEDAERDFDLLDDLDWFGISYAGYGKQSLFSPPKEEPGSGDVAHRLAAVERAHKLGINTWVSCEPVLDALDVINLIKCADYVDKWKIGKLNYFPSDIDWAHFGWSVEEVCKEYGRNYYIKEDLHKAMEVVK
jgi:DNA repair photolyase